MTGCARPSGPRSSHLACAGPMPTPAQQPEHWRREHALLVCMLWCNRERRWLISTIEKGACPCSGPWLASATSDAPCWGLYKAQLVDQPGRNAQSMRHLPHTETLCSPTTNPDAFYRIVPWYRTVAQAHRSGLRGSQSPEPPALRGCVRSLVRASRTRARKLRLAPSSGN